MNERIRELAEQAYEQQPLMVANCETFEIEHKIGHGGAPMYHRVFNQEKFAKLIVQECARIARATPCPYEEDEVRQRLGHTWDMASLEAGREIVKHFGVEK
jgi:hypothetical protein